METYDTEHDAAAAHDRAVLAALGPAAAAADLNFPAAAAHLTNQPGSSAAAAAAAGAWAAAGADPGRAAGGPQQQQQAQREYKGVAWDPVNLKYQAQALDSTGAVQLLGLYSTAEEAAAEYDRRLVKSGIRDDSKLNFGLACYLPLACQPSSMAASAASSLSSLSGQGSMGMHASAVAAAELAAPTASNAAAAAAAGGAAGYAYSSAEEATDVEAVPHSAHAASAAAVTAAGARGKGRSRAKGVQKSGSGRGGRRSNPQSQYKGVSWSAATNRWAAVIWDR